MRESVNARSRRTLPVVERRALLDFNADENYEGIELHRASKVSAWINVQRGCNYRCTYCIVPYTRGSEKNRDPNLILAEVRALHKEGFGSEYDVLRLEVEVSNLEPNLRRAQNSVQQKLRDLAVELDVDPATLRVEGSLATLVLDDATANAPANSQLLASAGAGAGAPDEEALVQEALRSRSDIRQLAVTEATGRSLDVVVDNVVVGKTPWEGRLAVGRHSIALRGEGDEGTAPAEAVVRAREVTRINLSATLLDASLRVTPTPATSLVSIDGVVVGQGIWEGKLPAGSHKVEIAAEGFLPQTQNVTLEKGGRVATAAAPR